MKKKIASIIILMLFIPAIRINSSGAANTRTVTGVDGTKIDIPDYPERIACFYHPAYDKIVMLSSATRIAMLPQAAAPWARRFYPELKAIPVNTTPTVPDVEKMLKLKVDLVFYPKGKINISGVEKAGFKVICPFNDGFIPANINEYTAEFKKQVLFFGEILGPEAKIRARKYCKYLEDITARVTAITAKIPEANKPGIYYGKLADLHSTQGKNTIMKWYTEIAGGIYLPKKLANYFATVNTEQIFAWDPDIVLLGIYGSFDAVSGSGTLSALRAFRSGKVFKIPMGIFCWDMTSCETALLPLFLGKKFHPALFKDWDILKEMKKFYSEIYKIKISDRDADRILNGLPPE